MTRNIDDYKRSKGSDKKKKTFELYGKNTPKGMRIKQEKLERLKEKNKNK